MSGFIEKEFENGKLFIVSQIGEKHVKENRCNEDSYSYKIDRVGNYAFVVADGVSSCKNSKIGSMVACEVIIELFPSVQCLTIEEIKRKIFTSWKSRIESNWNDYGTTLNFIYKFNNRTVYGKIGDGIVIIDDDNDFFCLSDASEFYTSETFAFGEAIKRTTFIVKECITSSVGLYCLMTDGVAKEIETDKLKDFSKYIKNRISEDSFSTELDTWMNELSLANNDDKTILIWDKRK